jgi:signal transduction histidine kinase
LIAHAPDAVLCVDRAGVIRLWNRRAETLFGYSAEEAIGHTLDLIWSSSGHVWGIMAIGHDVTERRAHEQVQQERVTSLKRWVTALTQGKASGRGQRARRGSYLQGCREKRVGEEET